jgi:hypothetical protein
MTETQLKAKELKLDIEAVRVKDQYRMIKLSYVRKAKKIVNEVDLVGHAQDYDLNKLEEMLWKIRRLASTTVHVRSMYGAKPKRC